MKEIQEHKIKIYEFPETDDEEEMKMVRKIKVCVLKATLNETLNKAAFRYVSFILCLHVCVRARPQPIVYF